MNVKTPLFHAIFNLSIAYLKQVICVLHLTDLNIAGKHSIDQNGDTSRDNFHNYSANITVW